MSTVADRNRCTCLAIREPFAPEVFEHECGGLVSIRNFVGKAQSFDMTEAVKGCSTTVLKFGL